MAKLIERCVPVQIVRLPCCGDHQVIGSSGHDHVICDDCQPRKWYDLNDLLAPDSPYRCGEWDVQVSYYRSDDAKVP